jgi:secreted PhoX family phosphatase
MDRPEWLAIDTASRWVYCTLTNNSSRGQAGLSGVDAANPRANNVMGQIIRWKEDGDFDGESFEWNHLVLAGDPATSARRPRGNVKGDCFACPDGISFDARGTLWVQTDMGPTVMNKGEMARIGNNQMLACDLASGEMRRFPRRPGQLRDHRRDLDAGRPDDVRQHPASRRDAERAQRPGRAAQFSNWPDFRPGGRPRSATVVVRKLDGGVIGT